MKYILKIVTILLPLLLVNNNEIYPQINQEWTANYNHNNTGTFKCVSVDNSGNIIAVGAIENNSRDYLIIKYSTSGNRLWIATYNSSSNDTDNPFGLAIDDSNNIYVTGWSIGIGTNYDYLTVKYNPTGIKQWEARYNGPANRADKANAIAVDSFQNIYVTGQSIIEIGTVGEDIVTIKYNSDGVEQWVRNYSGSFVNSPDRGSAITFDNESNVYVVGRSNDSIDDPKGTTIKYNQNGDLQWVAKYDGAFNGQEEAKCVKVDFEGNVYFGGLTEVSNNFYDYVIIKYNSQGIQQWARTYNGSSNFIDQVQGMEIDNIGNVYITGFSTETGTGYDFTTIKYNSTGNQIWLRRYNNGSNDTPKDMKIDSFGNIYITGDSDGNGTDDDFATVKYDSSGNQKWIMRYNYGGSSVDIPMALDIDNNGNIYVAGKSNEDYLLIKYSQLTGTATNVIEIPSEYKLFQNYPNPFNPITKISYELRVTSYVSLKVFDVIGHEVAALINQKQNSGRYEVEFDGSNLPSGVYFYYLAIDGYVIDTNRMVLLK